MLTIETEKLFEAIKKGEPERITEIIDRDRAMVNAKNKTGATGILYALYAGRPEIAELIATRKSGLDIFEAASLGRLPELERLVRQKPGLVSDYSDEGFTALQLAAYIGKAEAVNFLLEKGAEVNAVAKNPTKYTALSGAVARGHQEIVST